MPVTPTYRIYLKRSFFHLPLLLLTPPIYSDFTKAQIKTSSIFPKLRPIHQLFNHYEIKTHHYTSFSIITRLRHTTNRKPTRRGWDPLVGLNGNLLPPYQNFKQLKGWNLVI